MSRLLAWFDLPPTDAALTEGRVNWLRLALLRAGRADEAAQPD